MSRTIGLLVVGAEQCPSPRLDLLFDSLFVRAQCTAVSCSNLDRLGVSKKGVNSKRKQALRKYCANI